MSASTHASLPSRVAVRWYRIAVIVLGMALTAVTALATYVAVNNPTAAAVPLTDTRTGNAGAVTDHPCWQVHVPC